MVILQEVLLIVSLIPAAIDDFHDYYIDDYMWLPTLPFIAISIGEFGGMIYEILVFYLAIFLPVYIILKVIGEGIGEGDMILYFVYVFYAPYFGELAAYLMMILLTNLIGLVIPILRRGLGLDSDAIPLVSASPLAILATSIIL